ncbi:MAG: phosphatase PAP2 family protein [Candidatus Acidiferrales bacterium]
MSSISALSVTARVCLLAIASLFLAGSSSGQSNSSSLPGTGASVTAGSPGVAAKPSSNKKKPTKTSDTCALKHLGQCLKDVGQGQAGIWTSPFRLEPSDAAWLLPIAGATGVALHYDGQALQDLGTDSTRTDVSSAFSNAGFYGSLAGDAGMYFMGVMSDNDHLAETGRLGAEAVADASLVVEGLKLVTNRERPNEGNGQGGFWPHGTNSYEWDGSFPSEHAAGMFALAHVISSEYPSKRVAIAAYAFALAVSASRVTAREHFPSDVLVGGTIGYLVGGYVVHRRASSPTAFLITPVLDQSTRTYALQVQFKQDSGLHAIESLVGRLRRGDH